MTSLRRADSVLLSLTPDQYGTASDEELLRLYELHVHNHQATTNEIKVWIRRHGNSMSFMDAYAMRVSRYHNI